MTKVVSFEDFKSDKEAVEAAERRKKAEERIRREAEAFLAGIAAALVCSNDDNIGDE